jgi:hypothetical protein
MQRSDETRRKISESMKLFHETRKVPPTPPKTKIDLMRDAFAEGSGKNVVVRTYGDLGVKENETQTRQDTQNNALQEKR